MSPRTRARVCVVRQYYYPLDIRVRREVEALLAAGHEVDVVCLRAAGEPARETDGRLRIIRLPMAHSRGGRIAYLARYARFLVMATVVVAARHLRRRYRLVQVHSLPDVLVLAGLLPRLLGARLVLDLHETMPEFFATKFRRPLTHPAVRLVARAEQFSIRQADHVLTCTNQMKEAFVSRGAKADRITVLLNSADESVFDVDRFPPSPDPSTFTLICHGTIEERYGLDTVLEAVALLAGDLPDLRFRVIGSGEYREELVRIAERLGVRDRLDISEGFVPMEDLLSAVSRAHVGVVAMKRDAFRDLTHCNKMYEFLAMRVPVICSRTRSVNAYFPDGAFRYFEPGDAEDLARAIRSLHGDPAARAALVHSGTAALAPYRWQAQRQAYQHLIGELLSTTSSPDVRAAGMTTMLHPEGSVGRPENLDPLERTAS